MTSYEARLRDVAASLPIESIGLYCEGNTILWRDCLTGESGPVLRTASAVHSAKMALRCMQRLREEYAVWNWPAQLENEIQSRWREGRERRAKQEKRRRAA